MEPQQSDDDSTTIVYNGPDNEVVHLPLLEVSIKCIIIDGTCPNDLMWHAYTKCCFSVSAHVTLTHTFANPDSSATGRAKYMFPVPARGAVCAFQLETSDGRHV